MFTCSTSVWRNCSNGTNNLSRTITNQNQTRTMKTSNKLILTALLLVFIFLFAYDNLLKREYLSGNYRNPYRNFIALKFKDFDTVDMTSSTAANAKFIQGPFSIKID